MVKHCDLLLDRRERLLGVRSRGERTPELRAFEPLAEALPLRVCVRKRFAMEVNRGVKLRARWCDLAIGGPLLPRCGRAPVDRVGALDDLERDRIKATEECYVRVLDARLPTG
ncbi:MAG: hypothetical protein IT357_02460 [Gemmatimonadaceae bacterium]|nr:hypothetical protein [Gemmatimonadaceae bacterium]